MGTPRSKPAPPRIATLAKESPRHEPSRTEPSRTRAVDAVSSRQTSGNGGSSAAGRTDSLRPHATIPDARADSSRQRVTLAEPDAKRPRTDRSRELRDEPEPSRERKSKDRDRDRDKD